MNPFDQLPKSLKKLLRYINQDVNSLDKLEQIEKTLEFYINKRKFVLENDSKS